MDDKPDVDALPLEISKECRVGGRGICVSGQTVIDGDNDDSWKKDLVRRPDYSEGANKGSS